MRFSCLLIITFIFQGAFGQKEPIEQIWYNQEKTSKIQVYKATNGKYYGKIVWLQTPNGPDGKPRTDKENPEKEKRNKPLMNLLILTDFEKSSQEGEYTGGKVYDPNNGKTYCGKLTVKGKTLDLRGYICGLSWLGRTSQWTLAD